MSARYPAMSTFQFFLTHRSGVTLHLLRLLVQLYGRKDSGGLEIALKGIRAAKVQEDEITFVRLQALSTEQCPT